MKHDRSVLDLARLFVGLLLVAASGCSAAAPESEEAVDELSEQRDDALGSDPCEGQPNSENRGYPYYIVGYACSGEFNGGTAGYQLFYCWDGQTRALDCTPMAAYCMDYASWGPGYGAYCEQWGN